MPEWLVVLVIVVIVAQVINVALVWSRRPGRTGRGQDAQASSWGSPALDTTVSPAASIHGLEQRIDELASRVESLEAAVQELRYDRN